jgi:adhesin isopeptide-forming family sspB-C2 type protein
MSTTQTPRKRWRAASLITAFILLVSGLAAGMGGMTANAAVGGGSLSGGGDGPAGDNTYTHFSVDDGPKALTQGVGQASIDYFVNTINSLMSNPYGQLTDATGMRAQFQDCMSTALANADARAKAVDPSYPGGQSRGIYVYYAWNNSPASSLSTFYMDSMVIPQITGYFKGGTDIDGRQYVGGATGTGISNFDTPNSASDPAPFGDALLSEALAQVATQKNATHMVCLAASPFEPVTPGYELGASTKAGAAPAAGSTDQVCDTISLTNNGSTIVEDLSVTSTVVFTGQNGQQKTSTKSVTGTNNGDTEVCFAPSELGLTEWTPGDGRFDLQVTQQGKMTNSVDMPDDDPAEAFLIPAVPPNKDAEKHITEGTSADSMYNISSFPTDGGIGGSNLWFDDTVWCEGQECYVDDQYVTQDGAKVDFFTFNTPDGTTLDPNEHHLLINFDPSKVEGGLVPGIHSEYVAYATIYMVDPGNSKVRDSVTVHWTGHGVPDWESTPPEMEFPTWTFTPDKVLTVPNADGVCQTAIDPDWTNEVAADGKTFLNGSDLCAVINGTIGADLAQAPKVIQLGEFPESMDYIWDAPTDPKDVRFYIQDVTDDEKSSVPNILETGKDITDQVTIDLKAMTLTLSDELSASLVRTSGKQITATLKGVANYANMGVSTPEQIEAGNQQALEDFGKQTGDELHFCVNPDNAPDGLGGTDLTNSATQTVNGVTKPTNKPGVCGYVPPVVKDVLSAAAQGGNQYSINGKTVTGGQIVTYKLTTTPTMNPTLGTDVVTIGVDDLPEWVTPDRSSIMIIEKTLGVIPLGDMTITSAPSGRGWVATLSKTAVAELTGTVPSFEVTFDATVDEDLDPGTIITNEWTLILDKSRITSNIVKNPTPTDEPSKDVVRPDTGVSINGKTTLVGDEGSWVVYADKTSMSDGKGAYAPVQFCIQDPLPTEHLDHHLDQVKVLGVDGTEVTASWSQHYDETTGTLTMCGKLADTLIPATGETINSTATTQAGVTYSPNTVPGDVPGFAAVPEGGFDPLTTATLDPVLSDGVYKIVIPFTVASFTDQTITNQATQVMNGVTTVTNVVGVPVKQIEPTKDVVVNIDDPSANDSTIILGSNFLYQIKSSVLPANRAYPEVVHDVWDDQLNLAMSTPTAKWICTVDTDLYSVDGKSLIAAAGTTVGGSDDAPVADEYTDMCGLTISETGQVHAWVTEKYQALEVADTTHEHGISFWVQMLKISVGDETNQFKETLTDGSERLSNIVITHTPDQTPSISLEKYDLVTGVDTTGAEGLGNRDTMGNALSVKKGEDVKVGYLITNTGGTDLVNIKLTDQVTVGGATVTLDPDLLAQLEQTTLTPGATFTVTGVISGITGDHTNVGTVEATPVLDCPVVDDNPWDDVPAGPRDGTCTPERLTVSDPWNAKVTPPTFITGGLAVNSGPGGWVWLLVAGLVLVGATVGAVGWSRHRS